MDLFNNFSGGIVTVGVIAGGVVVGILYLLGIFKGKKDNADDRLINILKTTVDELEKKVNQQTLDIDELTKEVHDLKKDNEKYIKILEARDEQTKEFYQRAFSAMEKVDKTHDSVTTMEQSIKNTSDAMNRLIGVLEKSIEANKGK